MFCPFFSSIASTIVSINLSILFFLRIYNLAKVQNRIDNQKSARKNEDCKPRAERAENAKRGEKNRKREGGRATGRGLRRRGLWRVAGLRPGGCGPRSRRCAIRRELSNPPASSLCRLAPPARPPQPAKGTCGRKGGSQPPGSPQPPGAEGRRQIESGKLKMEGGDTQPIIHYPLFITALQRQLRSP